MNKLELKELTQKYVVYFYRPEDRGTHGEISMKFSDEKASIVLRAGENSHWHDRHALTAVEKCVKEQDFPLKFTQAWY